MTLRALIVFVALATAVRAGGALAATPTHYEATFCPNGCTITDNQFICFRKGGITLDTNVLTASSGKIGNHSFISFIVVVLDQAKPLDFTALFFNSSALTPPACNMSTEVGRSHSIRVGTCTNLEVQLNETYMFSFYVVPKNQSASGSSGSESWCSGAGGGGGGKHDASDDDLSAWEIGLIIAAAVAASIVVLLGVGGTAFFLIHRQRASYEVINSLPASIH
jgi:hypothetical protein